MNANTPLTKSTVNTLLMALASQSWIIGRIFKKIFIKDFHGVELNVAYEPIKKHELAESCV